MIHSARPTGSPVVIIVFSWKMFCFWKSGTDGRTDDMCGNMITTGRDCGSVSWINLTLSWLVCQGLDFLVPIFVEIIIYTCCIQQNCHKSSSLNSDWIWMNATSWLIQLEPRESFDSIRGVQNWCKYSKYWSSMENNKQGNQAGFFSKPTLAKGCTAITRNMKWFDFLVRFDEIYTSINYIQMC